MCGMWHQGVGRAVFLLENLGEILTLCPRDFLQSFTSGSILHLESQQCNISNVSNSYPPAFLL